MGFIFLLKRLLRDKLVYLLHSKLARSLKSSHVEKPTRRGNEANSQHPGPVLRGSLLANVSSNARQAFGWLQPLLTSDCDLGRPVPELPSHTAPDFPTQRNHEAYLMKLAAFSISGLDNLLCSNRQITYPLIVHMPPLYFENPMNSTLVVALAPICVFKSNVFPAWCIPLQTHIFLPDVQCFKWNLV